MPEPDALTKLGTAQRSEDRLGGARGARLLGVRDAHGGYNPLTMERGLSTAMHEWPRRHRISVEHFYRMAEAGLFAADERVELIQGEIIDMAPIGTRHASCAEQLATALVTSLGARGIVRSQLPVRLGPDSEPQPDLAVVAPRPDRYRANHPGAADVLLLIEISKATLRFDLEVKVPLYARHAIRELWILDLNKNEVHVHEAPRDGAYAMTTTERFGRRQLAAFPDVTLDLASLA
jgi:Uma2 family endonuclease